MEKDTKQHSISYNKGITNQPSYILTDDGELSECHGLTFENGELKPLQNPKKLINNTEVPNAQILAVHDGRYIYQNNGGIYWSDGQNRSGAVINSFSGELKDIVTVGNTVVITTSLEMQYALWDGGQYTPLGSKIPEPHVRLHLYQQPSASGAIRFDSGQIVGDDDHAKPTADYQQTFNDEVWGELRRLINLQHKSKCFVFPFVARVAVELYNGSYTFHSSPYIMLPWYGGDHYMFKNDNLSGWGHVYAPGVTINYSMGADYSKWSDIVRNVTLFVSREVDIFEEDAVFFKREPEPAGLVQCGYMLYRKNGKDIVENLDNGYPYFHNNSTYWDEYRIVLKRKDDSEILRKLKEESVFFKLCDLGLTPRQNATTQGSYDTSTIQNIEAQLQLPNEDYHTHDNYVSNKLYSYNGRLHLAGIKRKLFGGFIHLFGWDTEGTFANGYTIIVKIHTDNGDKYVKAVTGQTYEGIGAFYFYYPDSRAKTAYIYSGNNIIYTLSLTEHPGLNGAYYIGNSFPETTYAPYPTGSSASIPAIDDIENLNRTMMVSEVDNPFLFLPQGYVNVGNTSVVGMAAVTMALSEYQHGHQPLVVFTEDGIWSLSLNAEGYYIAGQAVSREVCNNASSITQVDNGIFFVSAKGLMYLDTAGVKCVSAQMKGTTFDDFIDTCFMAYDYRDSLLKIYKPGASYHYVYNMKTGTFSTSAGAATSTVNNYPDTLIQYHGSSWETYSLLDKPDEQHDGEPDYFGHIETRPMKFGNILTLKTIRHIRHLYSMNSNATVNLTVMASNDGVNWATLTSLRGKPWKLYKFRIEFDHMYATDRYAGTVVWTQERRTEKPR